MSDAYIDRAVSALQKRRQVCSLAPYDGKIADITHADVLEHSMPLPSVLPSNVVAMDITVIRIAGTGVFRIKSKSGGRYATMTHIGHNNVWYMASDGLFYYELNNAGDDWDIYCLGYWMQGVQ